GRSGTGLGGLRCRRRRGRDRRRAGCGTHRRHGLRLRGGGPRAGLGTQRTGGARHGAAHPGHGDGLPAGGADGGVLRGASRAVRGGGGGRRVARPGRGTRRSTGHRPGQLPDAAAGRTGRGGTRGGAMTARHTPRGQGRGLDLRCYLVTSGTGRRTVETAAAAAAAGAGVVQVRAKEATAAGLLELVLAVARAVQSANPATTVLVDDRADVAAAARRRGAAVHGVHLGQEDLPVADARDLLGPEAVIGLTTGTLELVRAAEQHRAQLDYVGAGPFRLTPTKDSGRPPLGVDGYVPLVAASSLPIVAIGDITPADAAG